MPRLYWSSRSDNNIQRWSHKCFKEYICICDVSMVSRTLLRLGHRLLWPSSGDLPVRLGALECSSAQICADVRPGAVTFVPAGFCALSGLNKPMGLTIEPAS